MAYEIGQQFSYQAPPMSRVSAWLSIISEINFDFVKSHSILQNIVASKETSFTLNRAAKLEQLSKTQIN